MQQPVFRYKYGNAFDFINIAKIVSDTINGRECESNVVFNMKNKRIMLIIAAVAESCEIVRYIDNHELSHMLLYCVEDNLGYTLVFRDHIDRYLKHSVVCRVKLLEYLAKLIKDSWPIQELKEMIMIVKMECMEADEISMLENVLVELLDEESQRRFLNVNAKKIQLIWRSIIANPYHPCCQRRLIREAEELAM